MCEVMEKYINEAVNETVNEAEIKATIKSEIRHNSSDEEIIEVLMDEFALTKDTAKEALQNYKK